MRRPGSPRPWTGWPRLRGAGARARDRGRRRWVARSDGGRLSRLAGGASGRRGHGAAGPDHPSGQGRGGPSRHGPHASAAQSSGTAMRVSPYSAGPRTPFSRCSRPSGAARTLRWRRAGFPHRSRQSQPWHPRIRRPIVQQVPSVAGSDPVQGRAVRAEAVPGRSGAVAFRLQRLDGFAFDIELGADRRRS